MDWFSDYLEQLIILILIAICLDLLLPSNSLDRYVKFVMGLLILIMMLQPIFQFVQQQTSVSIEKLLTESEDQNIYQFPHMQQIQDNAKQFTLNQQQQNRELLENQIIKRSQELVQSNSSASYAENINVKATLSENNDQLQSLYIILQEADLNNDEIQNLISILHNYWNISKEQIHITQG